MFRSFHICFMAVSCGVKKMQGAGLTGVGESALEGAAVLPGEGPAGSVSDAGRQAFSYRSCPKRS